MEIRLDDDSHLVEYTPYSYAQLAEFVQKGVGKLNNNTSIWKIKINLSVFIKIKSIIRIGPDHILPFLYLSIIDNVY